MLLHNLKIACTAAGGSALYILSRESHAIIL